MNNIEVDIVIPVYDGYEELVRLYDSFKTQKNITIKNIVIPLTIGENPEQVNKTKKFIKTNNLISFDILKKDFSHSLAREKAIFNYCKSNIVILLTQDVILINEFSMYNLIKDISSDRIVYTFGRQICTKKRSLERYIRDFNYPKDSYVVKKELTRNNQIRVFFASDVFAALNRNIFIKLKGYKGINIPTNEDMFYMYILLSNNYEAKYCSNALVEHYHTYNIKSLYNRYYRIGTFFKKIKVFDQYKKNNSGKKLAFYVLKEAFTHFDIISIIRWLPNMAVRYFAMKKGSR